MRLEDLGEIKRTFKPGMENIIAGYILSLLLLGGGAAITYYSSRYIIRNYDRLPFWIEKGQCWGPALFVPPLGVGMAVAGYFLGRFIWGLGSFRVLVGQHGFASANPDGSYDVVAWDDIVSVQENHLYERMPLRGVAKYAVPKHASKNYDLALRGGATVGFDGTSVKGHNALAKIIRDETDCRGVPWKIVEKHE